MADLNDSASPSSSSAPASLRSALNATVLVAALGYFVDIFDLLLFGIVRIPSLRALGVEEGRLLEVGVMLDNTQTIGLLLGGIIWGIMGDRRGRLATLFGSIALYSIANIANAFVTTVPSYAVWRFLAGLGLAGELGAAITLVSEVLPRQSRGYGTAIVAAVGVTGAVAANFVAKILDWQGAYLTGGSLGLVLLLLRVKLAESTIFHKTTQEHAVRRGDFFQIFSDRSRLLRYLQCIAIGVPLWFGVGILMKLAPEFGKALDVSGPVTAGDAIAWCYTGLVLGDVGSGFLSQWMQSRKQVVRLFLVATLLCFVGFLHARGVSPTVFYAICFACGLAWGYWAVFMTITAENFGTNLRATVTTTVPNFVRGSVPPMSMAFLLLREDLGIIHAALLIGLIVIVLGFWALHYLKETHGRDLDFVEE